MCIEWSDHINYIDIVETINIWVQNKDILEVEYVLPSMSYRTKSFYFCKGTEFRIPF